MLRKDLVGQPFILFKDGRNREVKVIKLRKDRITVQYVKAFDCKEEILNIYDFAKLAGIKIED